MDGPSQVPQDLSSKMKAIKHREAVLLIMIRNCQHWLEENEEEKQKVLAAAALANDKEAIDAHSNYRYNKNDYNDAMWSLLD